MERKNVIPESFSLAFFDEPLRQVADGDMDMIEKQLDWCRVRIYSMTVPMKGDKVVYRVQIEASIKDNNVAQRTERNYNK